MVITAAQTGVPLQRAMQFNDEDSDVMVERDRINNTDKHALLKTDSIVLQKYGKQFYSPLFHLTFLSQGIINPSPGIPY